MEVKINKKVKKLIFHCGILILFSVSYHFIDNKLSSRTLHKDLIKALNQRLVDYKDIFPYLEEGYLNFGRIEPDELLANKKIYLHERKMVSLGALTINALSPTNFPRPRVSGASFVPKSLKEVTTSAIYLDLGVIPEPLVDLNYFFYSAIGELLCFSTTILARDLFIYSPNFENILVPSENSSIEGTVLFIEPLKAQVFLKNHPGFFKESLPILILAYILAISFYQHIRVRKKLKYKDAALKSLQNLGEEQKNLLNLFRQIMDVKDKGFLETIDLVEVIKLFSTIYVSQLQNSHVNVSTCCVAGPLVFKGNKSHWYILIGSIMEIMIKNSPPNSTLTCQLLNTTDISQIIFKDSLPLFYPLREKLFDNKNSLSYMPSYDLETLLQRMNLFLNFSFCEKDGNTLSIAIPTKQKKTKESAHVIIFPR